MSEAEAHYRQSILRERIVEHIFIGEVLRKLWSMDITNVEVLRSEFDANGYDLVMECGRVVRHIQFKTGTSKPRDVSVALALTQKPSGCVIFIQITSSLQMGPYFWFGGMPGEVLPPISHFSIPTRTTPNKQGEYPARQNHRVLPSSAFTKIETLDAVIKSLFGPLRLNAVP